MSIGNHLKIAAPFLATCQEQLKALSALCPEGVEAVIFNREDLEGSRWKMVWQNISLACELYGPQNVVFHFPVNNSDYVEDLWVRDRLRQGYSLCKERNLAGMVVHANRVQKISFWQKANLSEERKRLISVLADIVDDDYRQGSTWLGLENMPVMDNHGIEIDPLFCFPDDFLEIRNTGIKIVWDFCHYTNTLENISQAQNGKQDQSYYPNFRLCQLEDVQKIKEHIAHWHFSAFHGIANPDINSSCQEGVLPWMSTLGEAAYQDCLQVLEKNSFGSQMITLEIQEEDYKNRKNFQQMRSWIKNNKI